MFTVDLSLLFKIEKTKVGMKSAFLSKKTDRKRFAEGPSNWRCSSAVESDLDFDVSFAVLPTLVLGALLATEGKGTSTHQD